MPIHLAFFVRDEYKVGLFTAIMSITSLLFLSGSYFTLTQQDTVLIHAPNNDSLILPWWGWMIIAILAMLLFVLSGKRSISGVSGVIDEDRERRLDEKIDPDFPLTSSTQLLVKKNKEMYDQVNFLFLAVMLLFGWTFVIVPFILLGGIVFIISQFVPSIKVEGSWDWISVVSGVIVWLVGVIVTAAFFGLFHLTKDMQILTNRLSKLDLSTISDEDS